VRVEVGELNREGTMSNNRFSPEKFHDFTIVDEDSKVVGNLRVKPSGILWAPKNAKVWYGVSIDRFGEWMEQNGKQQTK
jgi:hypothetical protein